MKCKSCKKAIPDNSKYCAFCGKSVVKNCPSCGAKLIKDARYCNQCGIEIGSYQDKKKQDKKDSKLECPACGAELSKGATFCRNCGEKIIK